MTSSTGYSDVQALCRLIGEGADLLTFFTALTTHAAAWTQSDHADVVLEDVLVRRHVRGSTGEIVRSLPENDAATRWILEQGKPLAVTNASDAELPTSDEGEGYTAYLGVPIVAEGRTRGALYLRSKASRTFSETETEQVQSLAGLAGLAINQQILNNRADEHHRTMVRFALADPLTNLASQRHFDYMLKREWRRAQGEVSALSLLQLEIDSFESHEGRIGPQKNREILLAVARTLDGALYRPGDLAARLDHDRFVVMLPDTDHQGAAATAQRLVNEVSALALPHPTQEGRKVTLSIGTASHEPLNAQRMCDSAEELVQLSAEGLEQAQTVGGNQVRG